MRPRRLSAEVRRLRERRRTGELAADLQRLRERAAEAPPVELVKRADFRKAIVAVVVAIAVAVVGSKWGDLYGHHLHSKLIAIFSAIGFFIVGVFATRSAAGEIYRVTEARGGRQSAAATRLVILFVGYVCSLLVALGLLSVPVKSLLVGGALTGVVVGIALQQSLGNVVAGIYLLMARPFTVGDAIRVRSGSLGGEFYGVVTGMGLTYVSLETDEGALLVPNSGMLAAAIGPRPPREAPVYHPLTLTRERPAEAAEPEPAAGGPDVEPVPAAVAAPATGAEPTQVEQAAAAEAEARRLAEHESAEQEAAAREAAEREAAEQESAARQAAAEEQIRAAAAEAATAVDTFGPPAPGPDEDPDATMIVRRPGRDEPGQT